MSRAGRLVPPVVLVLLAALVLAPVLLGRGFVLVGDMTFVPDQPWKAAWLGLDASVPRAVPADAFVWGFSQLLPDDLLQKVILLGALVLAGLGMYRFVGELLPGTWVGPLGAGVLYLWNPWVLERLAIGQWGLVIGYAALPWIVSCAARFAAAPQRATAAPLVGWLAVAAWSSPTGGLLGLVVAAVLVLGRVPWRSAAFLAATALLMNAPWLLPGLLGSAEPTDVAGVEAFAARSDTPFGVPGSLLTLGGIWKQSIVPPDRGSVLLVAGALLIALAALGFLGHLAVRGGEPGSGAAASLARRVLGLGALGLVLAALPTFELGESAVVELVRLVPGAGILRDSQKWLALLALGLAWGFGLALAALCRVLGRAQVEARGVAVIGALLPVALLPGLAGGISGELEPVRYPAEWFEVRAILDQVPARDRRVVVLPFSAYQAFGWNQGRAALDPAIRFFPGDVLTNDALAVQDDRVVAGEDSDAALIAATLAADLPLAPVLESLGVRYVLVQRSAAGGAAVEESGLRAGGRVLYDGEDLGLIDLGRGATLPARGYASVVLASDALALGVGLGAILFAIVASKGRKRYNPG